MGLRGEPFQLDAEVSHKHLSGVALGVRLAALRHALRCFDGMQRRFFMHPDRDSGGVELFVTDTNGWTEASTIPSILLRW